MTDTPSEAPRSPAGITAPSNIRVIATDLDGTLCDLVYMHASTPEMIKKCRDNDILVIPLTGRSPQLATAVLEPAGLPSYPAGYHHGALTLGPDGKPVLKLTVAWDVIEALVAAAKRFETERGLKAYVMAQCWEAKFIVYEPDILDAENDPRLSRLFILTRILPDGSLITTDGSNDTVAGRYAVTSDMRPSDYEDIFQATIYNHDIEETDTIEWQKTIVAEEFSKANIEHVKTFRSGRRYIDTIHASADKRDGVRALGEAMGFSFDQVCAVGDNQNDIGMIKAARIGIAMGGAREDIKNAADMVAPAVRQGGWAKVVEEVLWGIER